MLRAADKASAGASALGGELADATKEATRLRKELFNRETLREINKQVTQAVINQTLAGCSPGRRRSSRRGFP